MVIEEGQKRRTRCLRPMGLLKAAHVARPMQLPEGVGFDRALRASRRLTSRARPLIEGKAAEAAASSGGFGGHPAEKTQKTM